MCCTGQKVNRWVAGERPEGLLVKWLTDGLLAEGGLLVDGSTEKFTVERSSDRLLVEGPLDESVSEDLSLSDDTNE